MIRLSFSDSVQPTPHSGTGETDTLVCNSSEASEMY